MSYISAARLFSKTGTKPAFEVKIFLVLVTLVAGFAFGNPVSADDSVGQCNAIAGQALGIVHRIDNGEDLCADLDATFNDFGASGCIPLLIDGELFLNDAVEQYFLACNVFKNICGADPQSFGICPFDI